MKKCLKKALLAAILQGLFLAPALFAVDFGGSLANFTRFKGNEFSELKLDQTDDLNLWIKVPFDKEGNIYFAAQGLYEFEYDKAADEMYHRADVSLFKLSARVPTENGGWILNAGRFNFSDVSGLVFSQNADGIFAQYHGSVFTASLYGAYTGLLNAQLVKMLYPPQDPFEYHTKKVYDLAAKYAVASVALSFPYLFAGQTLSAEFFATAKLDGKSFNRFYGTFAMNGPIYRQLYYDGSTTFQFSSFDGESSKVANLTRLNLTLYLPWKSFAVTAGGVYATGMSDNMDPFLGFTKMDAYSPLLKNPQYSGLLKLSVSASLKPIRKLLVYGALNAIFDAMTTNPEYSGMEYSAGINWQAFSDLLLGAGITSYSDKEDSANNKVQVSLNAQIVF